MLDAFERATGLQVCARLMSRRWRAMDGTVITPTPYGEHRSAFCTAIKQQRLAACIKCDVSDLPTVCSSSNERRHGPFVRTCHAGAREVLVPLWSEGQLTGVLFIGQFQSNRTRSGRAPVGSNDSALPVMPARQIEHLRTLAISLQCYFLDVLRRLDEHRREEVTGRRSVIETYVRRNLAQGPTLAGLAGALSLSPSRTSHVVRELTGYSFQQLVEERRIAIARDLLTGTAGKIAWITRQVGMTDTAYFCRYFKRKTGLTPTAYRKRHTTSDAV